MADLPNTPWSQEQLQASFNTYFSSRQGRDVAVVILGTQQRAGVPEWQSLVRYTNREGTAIEREVIFGMDEGAPCILVVTEARLAR